jgi:hypothetical protein
VIRRTVYFVAGIVVGGYVMYRFGRSARLWSPGGIADRVEKRIGSYREALREFNEDVAEAVPDFCGPHTAGPGCGTAVVSFRLDSTSQSRRGEAARSRGHVSCSACDR